MGKKSSTMCVGLDVHKQSIEIAIAEAGSDGDVRHVGKVGGDVASLDSMRHGEAAWTRSRSKYMGIHGPLRHERQTKGGEAGC